jgi:hypothetical protein
MSELTASFTTKFYLVGDATPEPIVLDQRYRQLTVTVQPFTPTVPITDPFDDVFNAATAIAKGSMVGTVQLLARPPRTFEDYELTDGLIDLSAPSFISISTPVTHITPVFGGISGSTHVAITVSNYP